MSSMQYAALQNSYELHETIGSGDLKFLKNEKSVKISLL